MHIKYNTTSRAKNVLFTLILLYITFLVEFRCLIRQWTLMYGIAVIFIFLLALYCMGKRGITFKMNIFSFLLCTTIIPMLYNNYYFKIGDYGYLNVVLFVYLVILFLKCEKVDVEVLNNIGLVVCAVSIFFAAITWVCFFKPSFYYNKIVPLFPSTLQTTLIDYYNDYGMLAGLTDHYSRNAYYILLGCMLLILNSKESKHKVLNALSIIFLFSTLLLIGKRGHLIFFIISLIVTYYMQTGLTITNFIKNNFKITICFIFILIIMYTVPGTNNFAYRLLHVAGSDPTNGRIYLYKIAIKMFSDSYYIGLGWGAFTHNVNYQYAGVHNDYLQLLCETGIWGFLIFMIFQLYIFKKSIAFFKDNINNNELASVCRFSFAFQVFFILYSFTGIPHYDYEVYIVYLIAASIPWIVDIQNVCKNDPQIRSV